MSENILNALETIATSIIEDAKTIAEKYPAARNRIRRADGEPTSAADFVDAAKRDLTAAYAWLMQDSMPMTPAQLVAFGKVSNAMGFTQSSTGRAFLTSALLRITNTDETTMQQAQLPMTLAATSPIGDKDAVAMLAGKFRMFSMLATALPGAGHDGAKRFRFAEQREVQDKFMFMRGHEIDQINDVVKQCVEGLGMSKADKDKLASTVTEMPVKPPEGGISPSGRPVAGPGEPGDGRDGVHRGHFGRRDDRPWTADGRGFGQGRDGDDFPGRARRPGGAHQAQEPEEQEEFDAKGLEEVLSEMDDMIGMDDVREQVSSMLYQIQNDTIARALLPKKQAAALPRNNPHMCFVGNPGTGKTTVARKMGAMMKQVGILKKGHVVEVDRNKLISDHIGGSEKKVEEILDAAKGGVLFIDEAYSLYKGKDNKKDFGNEIIAGILKAMEDGRDDFVVVFAGYPKEMDEFIKSNPGLESRVNRYVNFRDYNREELLEITDIMLDERVMTIDDDARAKIGDMLEKDKKAKGRAFSNGRAVRNLVEQASEAMSMRLGKTGEFMKHTNLKKLRALSEDDKQSLLQKLRQVKGEDVDHVAVQQIKVGDDQTATSQAMQEAEDRADAERLQQILRDERLRSKAREILDKEAQEKFERENPKNPIGF
ncbi:MAG: hypothetical protein Alpg2KO_13100 [Alphaproteobacteria bacterium]